MKAGCSNNEIIGRFEIKSGELFKNCLKKCDAEENCAYFWYRAESETCILYESCHNRTEFNQYKGYLYHKEIKVKTHDSGSDSESNKVSHEL